MFGKGISLFSKSMIVFVLIAIAVYLTADYFLLRDRIAFVESSKLIENFSETIKARHSMEEDFTEWDAEVTQLEDSLKSTVERLKEERPSPGSRRAEELKSELTIRNADLVRYREAVGQRKMNLENESMEPVIRKINEFVEIWAGKNNYDIILGTVGGGNIVHANPELDVTAKILNALNEHYKDAE